MDPRFMSCKFVILNEAIKSVNTSKPVKNSDMNRLSRIARSELVLVLRWLINIACTKQPNLYLHFLRTSKVLQRSYQRPTFPVKWDKPWMHSKNPVSLWSGRVGLQIQFKRRPRVEYKGWAQPGPFAFIICISPGHFTNICKCLSFLADFIVLCGGWIMIQIEWLAIERLTKLNGSPFNLKGLYLWSGLIL